MASYHDMIPLEKLPPHHERAWGTYPDQGMEVMNPFATVHEYRKPSFLANAITRMRAIWIIVSAKNITVDKEAL